MSEDRWERVKQIFQDAIEQPAEARRDLVQWYAEGDASIIEEVESLLAAYGEAQIVDAAIENRADERPDERIGERVGVYRLLGEIGRGGMGAIYRAVRDDDELRKEVAVKVVKRGMDSDAVVRRFRQERQILADLDHPNIAHLLDGGTTEAGIPYFVMEYIDGQPLDQYCQEHQLTLRDKLQLFQGICDAVDYAQRRGVVHRDIKPGNILINKDGVPKLLDFGIAKMLGTETDATKTVAGHQILTPAYASPEQLAGSNATAASDVYSLGVVLYELLTGARPFDADSCSIEDLARQRLVALPPAPSDTTDEHRRRRRQFRGDLDDIVLTALDPLPEHRYTSAGDLGRDIGRHLAGEPLQALRHGWSSRVRRAFRRRRAGITIAAVVVIAAAIVAALALTWWAIARSRHVASAQPSPARHTIDPQAHQAYLRGRYLWNQRTFDSFRKAIRFFEEAIRRDPGYAAAYAGLADCYLLLGWANAGPPGELFPQAKKAAFRALELDESLAEAHTSLAQIKYMYDWDFAGAEQEYRRAIDLDPTYATARQWYALFLSTMQRHPEALQQIAAAQQLDPVSRVINMNFAGTLAAAGRLDEAIDAHKRAIEIDPNFGNVWASLGGAYQAKGDYPNALAAFEQARRLYDDKPARLQELACVHAKMGHRQQALAMLAEMKALQRTTHVPPIKLALVYAALGDKDRAFEQLERAYATRSPDILGLADFDELRDDPRYADLLQRIGLPDGN